MARNDPRMLDELAPLLDALRAIPGLIEKTPGIFYVKRIPMLHFHRTGDGMVADRKRVSPRVAGFDRFALTGDRGKRRIIAEVAVRCRLLHEKSST